MSFLERIDRQKLPSGDGDEPNSDNSLHQFRYEAEQLLRAGDEAIRNALSAGNSQAFLRAGRQQGGQ